MTVDPERSLPAAGPSMDPAPDDMMAPSPWRNRRENYTPAPDGPTALAAGAEFIAPDLPSYPGPYRKMATD